MGELPRMGLAGPTGSGPIAPSFTTNRPQLVWVGLLTPVAGVSSRSIRIEGDELILGRDPNLPLASAIDDDSVSRNHARIVRRGDRFTLEDLQSANGTHVDGVPVLSCILHPGDTVQIGKTLYYFDLLLQPALPARGVAR